MSSHAAVYGQQAELQVVPDANECWLLLLPLNS